MDKRGMSLFLYFLKKWKGHHKREVKFFNFWKKKGINENVTLIR